MSGVDLKNVHPTKVALIGGALSVAFSLFPGAIFTLVFNYFTSLPLYMVALGWGWQPALTACMFAFVLQVLTVGIKGGLVYAVIHALPALLLTRLALNQVEVSGEKRWYPAGYLVSWIVAGACLTLGVSLVLLAQANLSPADMLQAWMTLFTKAAPQINKDAVAMVAQVFPGISGISWVMMVLVNLWVAQKILVAKDLNIRPTSAERDGFFHEWWDVVLVFSLLLMRYTSESWQFFGKNLALLVCIPLFLIGFNVIYKWARKNKVPRVWLVCLVLVTILLVWPAAIIISLGIVEPWLRAKKHEKDSKED